MIILEMEKRKAIGKEFLKKRNDLGINQREMATRLGINGAMLSNIECGKIIVNFKTLKRLADLLYIDIENLKIEEEQKKIFEELPERKFEEKFTDKIILVKQEFENNPHITFEEMITKFPQIKRYHYGLVKTILRKRGIISKKRIPKPEFVKKQTDMIELKKSGLSFRDISKIYGISHERIRQIIGSVKVSGFKTKKKYDVINNQEFWNENSNLSNKEISLKYNVPTCVIYPARSKFKTDFDFLRPNKKCLLLYVLEKLKENNFSFTFQKENFIINGKRVKLRADTGAHTGKAGNVYFNFVNIHPKKSIDYYILVGKAKEKIYCFIVPEVPNSTCISYAPTGRTNSGKYMKYLEAWELLKNEN